jgi:hypothetical protein
VSRASVTNLTFAAGSQRRRSGDGGCEVEARSPAVVEREVGALYQSWQVTVARKFTRESLSSTVRGGRLTDSGT